ncbi:MAG: NAD(P)/FAD-dependent oxidoreductase [Steroidobacteraceae bacterium]
MPIAVVGAGIIGVTIAFELKRRGQAVVLIDRSGPGRGASYGNMASVAVTEFMPASRPSVWAQMPKWILDPTGPVRLRPSYLPHLIPWFLRFLAASRSSRLRALEAAGAALSARVYEDLLPLLSAAGLSDALGAEGCLSLYTDEAEFAADREHIDIIERFGISYDVLSKGDIQNLEPAISRTIKRALLFPQNRSVRDPYQLVLDFARPFRELGGCFETGEVVAFDRTPDERIAALRLADGRRLQVGKLILCAGAFTGRLSKQLGEAIPLETERGYHTQIMAPGIAMRHSIIWPAHAFMVTPTAGGIRVGGTVEMAGLDAPPDFRRAKVLVKLAQEALPDLQAQEASEWMGHRPALPDTVPIIGPSAKTQGVYYATGHGHLGLTYAATTARLIGDLVTGMMPPIDMTPYRVDRF